MLAHAHKAAKSREAALLARQEHAMRVAWNAYLLIATRSPGIVEAFARGDLDRITRGIDTAAAYFANGWIGSFLDVGKLTVAHLAPKLVRKARPQVGIAFDQVDPLAVEAMQANRLRLVSNITQQQRNLVRPILVRGIQQGLGPRAMARELRNVIGLDDERAAQLDRYRARLEGLQSNAERVLSAGQDTGIDALSPSQIETMVSGKASQLVGERALVIARTEATIATSLAQREGLRQSLESVGHSRQLVGHQWNCTHDARTREAHDAADGQRRRVDDAFEVGGESIMAPGQGSARNSCNCRCVETFEFFDTEAELAAWLAGGGS